MATGHPTHQFAAIAAASITASFAALLTMQNDGVGLVILNSLDQGVEISFDGTNVVYEFAAGEPLVLNYFVMNRLLKKCVIYIRYQSAATTTGRFRVTVIR